MNQPSMPISSMRVPDGISLKEINSRLTKNEVAERLREHGVSPTSQRVEIAHFLYQKQMHLSADQILEGVNQEYPAVSRGTVYNALNLLVGKALIREVIAAPGKIFYDPNIHTHHHIFYVDRGTLEDLPEEAVQVGTFCIDSACTVERVDVVVRARG